RPAAEDITDEEIARAIAEWTATSAAAEAPAAESAPPPEPAPMAFGETHDVSPEIDSAVGGFVLPDAAALTEPEPQQDWTPAPAAEPALVEVQEPAKTQALVLEQFETAVETQIEEPPQAAVPEGPHVLPAAAERTFAPYEFEVLAQPAPEPAPAEIVTAQATTTETTTAETTGIDTSVIEASVIEASVVEATVVETSAAAPAAAATAGTV